MVWKFSFGKKVTTSKQTVANNAVRDDLKSQGDDGVAVRHVVHYAYPLDATTDLSIRPTMIDELKAQGYEVKDAASQNGLVFEHHQSVAPGAFDDLTGALDNWFKQSGWEYDGWECAVVEPKH